MIAKKQDDSLQFLYRVILLLQTQGSVSAFLMISAPGRS